MKYSINNSAKRELIELLFEYTKNSNNLPVEEILRRNNFSELQWDCFVSLSQDLELNEDGAGILLDEIIAGRVFIPCLG